MTHQSLSLGKYWKLFRATIIESLFLLSNLYLFLFPSKDRRNVYTSPSQKISLWKWKLDSLRRRASSRNVSFRISLRWPIHIINSVDKTKLSRNTPHRRSTTVSLESYPLYGNILMDAALESHLHHNRLD